MEEADIKAIKSRQLRARPTQRIEPILITSETKVMLVHRLTFITTDSSPVESTLGAPKPKHSAGQAHPPCCSHCMQPSIAVVRLPRKFAPTSLVHSIAHCFDPVIDVCCNRKLNNLHVVQSQPVTMVPI